MALVILFVAIGRRSHGYDLSGILAALWPFAVAAVLAWIVVAALGDQGYGFRAGSVVWLVTSLGGVALRVLAGGTAPLSFILVGSSFLALFLFGWRLIYRFGWPRRSSS